MRSAWLVCSLLLLGGCASGPHRAPPTPGELHRQAFISGGEGPTVAGRRTFTAWTRTPTANEWLSDQILGPNVPEWRTDPTTGTVTFADGTTWVGDPLAPEPATDPAAYRWAEERLDEALRQIPRSGEPGVEP